jgi:hypothetical protein
MKKPILIGVNAQASPVGTVANMARFELSQRPFTLDFMFSRNVRSGRRLPVTFRRIKAERRIYQ